MEKINLYTSTACRKYKKWKYNKRLSQSPLIVNKKCCTHKPCFEISLCVATLESIVISINFEMFFMLFNFLSRVFDCQFAVLPIDDWQLKTCNN